MGKSYWIYLCFQDLVSFTVIISAIYTLREKGVEMLTRGVNQATTFKPEFYTLFTILNMNMYLCLKWPSNKVCCDGHRGGDIPIVICMQHDVVKN